MQPASSWQGLLFNPGEKVGFKAKPEFKPTPNEHSEFFCINPLKSYAGGAANANIAAHRNFLLESDSLSLPTQTKLFEDKMQLPFALKTFSGGKSFHYIIALEEPVPAADYADYWQYLKYLLAGKVDSSCSNPSRLSRTPNVKRASNGKLQRLKATGRRISLEEWLQWMRGGPNAASWYFYNTEEVPRLAAAKAEQAALVGSGELAEWLAKLNPANVPEGSRHRILMAAACSLVTTQYGNRENFLVDIALKMGKDGAEALKLLEWAERSLHA